MRWLKTHSDATRSHAAYWSGPAKRQWQASKESKERKIKKENANVLETDADERSNPHSAKTEFHSSAARSIQRHGSTKMMNMKALPPKGGYAIPRQIDLTYSRHLPTLPSETKAMSSFQVDMTSLKFYGEDFVRRFVMVDNEDSVMMFSSCLLLGYAHYMALTGQGTTMTLLELKSQVIHQLTAKMNFSDGLLSPRCLIAILALGAPIVCLVSRDLPKGLSIREYINVTLEEDYLCSEESAVVALSSRNEQIVHRHALRRLFLKSNTNLQDGESSALLRYISNYINMCVPSNFFIPWLRSNKLADQ